MKLSTSAKKIFLIAIAASFLLACDLTALLPGNTPRPTVVLQSPENGTTYKEGDDVPIQSASSDPAGIVRVELLVDGQVVATDAPPIPQGQVSFSLVQKWKAVPGDHTLSVRAYNAAGGSSDPASISITVTPGRIALATPTSFVPAPPPIASPPGSQPSATNTSGAISARPTDTRRPNTPTATRAAASPTSSAPPGVYAVSMRLDPSNPKVNQGVTFNVTFQNTTAENKKYRWFVKIYRPDERNSIGETAKKDDDFPAGRTIELASPNNWRIGGFGDCQPFFARVFQFDVETTNVTEILKSDGQALNQGFSVCP